MSSSATNKLVGTLSRKNKSKLKVASTAFTEYVEIHAAWANFHENFVIVYSSGIYFAPSPTFFSFFLSNQFLPVILPSISTYLSLPIYLLV